MSLVKLKNIKLTSFSTGGGCGCKIDQSILKKILIKSNFYHKNLLLDFNKSDDAAVYRINSKEAIIFTTDFFTPIVDNPNDFGKIAATNALSDIYAMGGKPLLALAIVAMPFDQLDKEVIKKILNGGRLICKKANIPIAGGHTIKSSDPIYGLAVIGKCKIDKITQNSKAKVNDKLILTKPIGIGILSSLIKREKLKKSEYKLLIKETTKLNDVGYYLANQGLIKCMTDVTGFGLLGHLKEICEGSKVTAEININKIPLINSNIMHYVKKGFYTGASKKNWDSVKKIVKFNNFNKVYKIILSDPQTSGGLLICCPKKNILKVNKTLSKFNFNKSALIGEILNDQKPNIIIN